MVLLKEEFEDTSKEIICRNSKKDRQSNGDQNDLQNTTQHIKKSNMNNKIGSELICPRGV